MTILSVKGLSKSYEKFKLSDVSFELDKGFIMGFIGRNGAGKTTTIKSLLGLVKPDCGEVAMLAKIFMKMKLIARKSWERL